VGDRNPHSDEPHRTHEERSNPREGHPVVQHESTEEKVVLLEQREEAPEAAHQAAQDAAQNVGSPFDELPCPQRNCGELLIAQITKRTKGATRKSA